LDNIGRKVLIAALLCGLLAAGCGGPSPSSGGSSGSGAQSLIIYTGRDKGEVDAVIAMFERKFPQYQGKVVSVVLGAQEELERLRAEKANPQAGFFWGGTQQGLQQAADEGLLAPSHPARADLLDASRKDPRGRWYAEMLLPEVIIYNHDLLKPDQAPKDWEDLITPAFKHKLVIRDVMPSGTMRTIFSAMIARHLGANGSAEDGYRWLKRLDANTLTYATTPDDMYLKLDQGVGVVTLWNLQDALIQLLKNNRPWSYVIPSSGVPILLDGVGVVNNPKSAQAAQEFEDFLLEPQLQLQLARDYYQIPAMQVPEEGKPDWLAKLKLTEMPLDWNLIAQKQDEWMDYWSQNIRGKGSP
jgi:iron(III) transport system substrate-binding protein